MLVNSSPNSYDQASSRISQIESELGHQNNEYLFLRSIWKSHSHQYTHAVVDFDDQLDRLNKIVGMMKKHVNYSVIKELNYQNCTLHDQVSVRQARALEAMNRTTFQAQEYRTILCQTLEHNEELKKTNEELKNQIQILKKQKKQDNRLIKELTEKNMSLENKILTNDFQHQRNETSFMRSSRGGLKQLKQLSQSKFNINILDNFLTQNQNKHFTERPKYMTKNRFHTQEEDDIDKWLDQSSIFQSPLNDSTLSITKHGFFGEPKQTFSRQVSQFENRQNVQESFLVKYQSEKRIILTKQRNVKNILKAAKGQQHLLEKSPKENLRFIRQNSKKSLLRNR